MRRRQQQRRNPRPVDQGLDADDAVYFILSPGANVVADLESQLKQDPPYVKGESYHNIAMGEGMDQVAMSTLETAPQRPLGDPNNVHLMPVWCRAREAAGRIPSGGQPQALPPLPRRPGKGIPEGILARCIKLTSSHRAAKANERAFCYFSKEQIEEADSKTSASSSASASSTP